MTQWPRVSWPESISDSCTSCMAGPEVTSLSFTGEGVLADGEPIPTDSADIYVLELAEWCAAALLSLADHLDVELSAPRPQRPDGGLVRSLTMNDVATVATVVMGFMQSKGRTVRKEIEHNGTGQIVAVVEREVDPRNPFGL